MVLVGNPKDRFSRDEAQIVYTVGKVKVNKYANYMFMDQDHCSLIPHSRDVGTKSEGCVVSLLLNCLIKL